jgi:hypothetical protein
LEGLSILHEEHLGSRALFVAEMYHEKSVMGHRSGWLRRLLLRLFGSLFVVSYLRRPRRQTAYASAYLFLAEKPRANQSRK